MNFLFAATVFTTGLAVSTAIMRIGRMSATTRSVFSFLVSVLSLYPLINYFAGSQLSFPAWVLSSILGCGVFYLLQRVSNN